jgi:hypothetical protein
MIIFWYSVGILLVWVAVLSLIGIWSRKDTWGRGCIVILFCCSIPLLFGLFSNALGNHRPISWEQLTSSGSITYLVLAHKIEYEKAIYLYLDKSGPPLALQLPWNTKTAEALQDAVREAGREGDVMVEIPYEESLDLNPPQFHAKPQPKFLPDKPIESEPAPYERGA